MAADLIVSGRRGRGAVLELLAGSVSQRLLHGAHVPVVVIPPAPRRTARPLPLNEALAARRAGRVTQASSRARSGTAAAHFISSPTGNHTGPFVAWASFGSSTTTFRHWAGSIVTSRSSPATATVW